MSERSCGIASFCWAIQEMMERVWRERVATMAVGGFSNRRLRARARATFSALPFSMMGMRVLVLGRALWRPRSVALSPASLESGMRSPIC